VNARGYIVTDPVTFETSVPGIYAGGDVSNEGPASIVKAAAAGKAIANRILARGNAKTDATKSSLPDVVRLLRHRSHRQRRVPAKTIPVAARDRDTEVMLTYPEPAARAEATRCLDCHAYCSICAGVCPNLAIQTYRSEHPGRQPFQVAVIADLCNECGNCTTFCPTSGRPFRDKPRLYLNRNDFEQQADNAYLVTRHGDTWHIEARYDGKTLHADLDGPNSDDPLAAEMCVLLEGLSQSLPFLPTMTMNTDTGRIQQPDYEE
jgi:putative selenate reductase